MFHCSFFLNDFFIILGFKKITDFKIQISASLIFRRRKSNWRNGHFQFFDRFNFTLGYHTYRRKCFEFFRAKKLYCNAVFATSHIIGSKSFRSYRMWLFGPPIDSQRRSNLFAAGTFFGNLVRKVIFFQSIMVDSYSNLFHLFFCEYLSITMVRKYYIPFIQSESKVLHETCQESNLDFVQNFWITL